MATKPAKVEMLGDRTVRVTWTGMQNGDDGEPFAWGVYADRSIQVTGNFGVGGSVTLEGSNDDSNFVSLSDLRGNALAINAAKLEQIEDCSYKVRPRVTAGDGTTALNVIIYARKVF